MKATIHYVTKPSWVTEWDRTARSVPVETGPGETPANTFDRVYRATLGGDIKYKIVCQEIRLADLATLVPVEAGYVRLDTVVRYTGPGWYSLADDGQYHRGEAATCSRIKVG